jgi:putative oxidoreductase
MKKILFGTENRVAPLIARLALGVVMFPHGAQKALGWFGGYGFGGTMHYFTESMHIPAVLAFLAIAAEFAGSIGLVTGFLSRIAALGIGVNMLVAIAKVHATNGFFMNWMGQQSGEGYEYHLLAIGLALIVLVFGGGALSVDRWIATRTPAKPERSK